MSEENICVKSDDSKVRVQLGIRAVHFIDIMRVVQQVERDYPFIKFDIEEGQFLNE